MMNKNIQENKNFFDSGNSNSKNKKQVFKTGIYGAQNLGFKFCNNNEWILFWGADDYASNSKVISNIRRTILENKIHDLIIDFDR